MNGFWGSVFSMLIVSGQALAGDGCVVAEVETTYSVVFCVEKPCAFQPGFGRAIAIASEHISYLCPDEDPESSTDVDINSFAGYGSASSLAWGSYCDASASVSLSASCLSVSMSTWSMTGTCPKRECTSLFVPAVSAQVQVETEIDCEWSLVINVETDVSCQGDVTDASLQPEVFWVNYFDNAGNPSTAIFGSRCVSAAVGCGQSDLSQLPLSGGPGSFSMGIVPAGNLLQQLDFDADGRLNEADAIALAALLPLDWCAADKFVMAAFDFDFDCDVDSADLDVFESIIETAGHGVLGDHNKDGVATCDDLDAVLNYSWAPHLTVCEPGYLVEFDADLDGVTDLEDRHQILRIIQPADYNTDGVVNFFDYTLFSAAFTNQVPDGDFNNDGIYDFFDISAFLAAFDDAC